MKDIMKKLLSIIFMILLCVASLFGGLWLHEKYFTYAPEGYREEALRGGINTMELYPFTGFHISANYHHVGDMKENQPYHDYDIQTADLGFFDFKLNEPYVKKLNEFRIIWIGGSGAQGWGARTNDDMMYRIIPKFLNEKLKSCNVEVTVFNFAMASSKSYQNFIALNRWGHRLSPDMIVSYSGRNDVVVPFLHLNDAFFAFAPLNAYVVSSRPDMQRGVHGWFTRNFPRTMEFSALGTGLRVMLDYNYYFQKGLYDYSRDTTGGIYSAALQDNDPKLNKQFLRDVVEADYASTFKSIKRDFAGIPIVIAWQAVKDDEWRMMGIDKAYGANFYQEWYARVQTQLAGYMNKQWYFYNVDAFMKNHPRQNTGTHLGNDGQLLASQYLATELEPVVRKLKGCRR